ncbi:hypothetical protein [Embleya hyalina]|uniref:Uncharacterized protein n=1 Tax=Embleya hyalina TaxID=516124 RepID=A0A401YVE0_9ACTN|nr:hypothetical protein [Embleya hyalina]GCD98588.1 hypothetical protein EHYA_06299 [Embleya hyalina]
MTARRTDPRPPEAWWSEEDQEWILGDKDEHGRLTGPVRYWDAAGRFVCECAHVAGRPHGMYRRYDHPGGELSQEGRHTDGRVDGVRRFHRPSTPGPRSPESGYGSGGPWLDAVESVRVYECVYVDGDLIGTRHLDGAGVEVRPGSGKPVPPRPEGVAPTASRLPGSGDIAWLFMRRRGEKGEETLETRHWWVDGTLQSEWTLDGTDRRYYRSGVLWRENRRAPRADNRPPHGTWRYHDVDGLLRRESDHDTGSGREIERRRTWHRTADEADGRGVTRSGPVEDAVEVGLWHVRAADGTPVREVRLGRLWGDADLLATPAAAELPYSTVELRTVLGEADADDPDGGPAQLARIRLAAREGAAALTTVVGDERPWPAVMVDGPYWHEGVPVSPLTPRSSLTEVIHALRWGEPAGPILARLAHDLFHLGHPHAALDVIDAALLLDDDADLHRTRAVLLRALGRDSEADAVAPDRDHVDPAAARLLLAIRERPADNGLRLAYAKLVAVSHPEHARLIHAQCGGNADGEDAAVAAYPAALPEKVRDVLIGGPERGFVRSVTDMEAETFLRHHDALFRAAPEDDRLELQFASDHLAEISLLPALGRYRGIRTYDTYLDGDAAARLARSPYLRQLESLALPDSNLDDDGLTALLTSHGYPHLRELDVSASRHDEQEFTSAGFLRLADAVFAPHLERLDLGHGTFDDLDSALVTVLPALPRLTGLTLDNHLLGDEVLTRLSELPNRFTALDLTSGAFTREGVDALVNSPAAAGLRSLAMAIHGDSTGAAMLTLVRGRRLGALRTLHLSGGHVDRLPPEIGPALAESVFVASLETLRLDRGRLGPDGTAGLVASFRRLRRLELGNCGIGDRGAVALAHAPMPATLRRLVLDDNEIGDEGALALARSPHLSGLEGLALRHNRFGARATRALRERFGAALHA